MEQRSGGSGRTSRLIGRQVLERAAPRSARASAEAKIRKHALRAAAEAQLASDRKAAYERMRRGGEQVPLPRTYGAQLKVAEERALAQMQQEYLASGKSVKEWRRLERLMRQE